jgi:hypothetical protein
MSEIYKLVQAIESYNESDLCLGTLRSLKKIKDAAAMLEIELADKYKQLAEARAAIERLSKRDGSAKHELVYDDGDNPFAREKLEHVDFGVADNNYVLESHLLNNTLEQIKAKDKLIEQMREALKAIDGIGREAGNARREDALRCFAIAAAALAAERGEK